MYRNFKSHLLLFFVFCSISNLGNHLLSVQREMNFGIDVDIKRILRKKF